jgi:hypothetical protein
MTETTTHAEIQEPQVNSIGHAVHRSAFVVTVDDGDQCGCQVGFRIDSVELAGLDE